MHVWSTKVHPITNQYNLESDKVHYNTGVLFVSYSSHIVSKPTVFSINHTKLLPNQEIRFKENKQLSFILCRRFETYAQTIREAK